VITATGGPAQNMKGDHKVSTDSLSEYDRQAQDFLAKYDLRITISQVWPNTAPAWASDNGGMYGEKYRITISRKDTGQRIGFFFWGSLHDMQIGEDPTAYDVLANIGSDAAYASMSASEVIDEYGGNSDSIREVRQARRIVTFAKKLAAFFTAEELDDLSEIR
jgi:hypothetical protein